jgi:hypothetical protein
MTTYTDHNLTDAQLARLSQIANNRPHLSGVALIALEKKGLVYEKTGPGVGVFGRMPYQHTHAITDAGVYALGLARKGGW